MERGVKVLRKHLSSYGRWLEENEYAYRTSFFRHYFCSACAKSVEPVAENLLMLWLGHRSSDMVRHYYHAHDREAQRQMPRIGFLGESDSAADSE